MGSAGSNLANFKSVRMNDSAKQKLYIIKVGGNVIDDAEKLNTFLKELSTITAKKILVHGGGKIATSIGNKLGIVSKYIDGRRITDDETIDLVTMVYGGMVNKKIVAKLQSFHCNAIGITGADANLIPAKKREVTEVDYGWAGDIENNKINIATWKLFLENGLIPVVAPLTHDTKGNMLNTNADTIASSIAVRLSDDFEVKLIFCFEKNGVLSDVNDENSVIANINPEKFASLKKTNKLFAGILPKIDNSFEAINKGVNEVVIGNSSQLCLLINGSGGTKLSMHE